MPKQVTHYKCLVISPGDVEDARAAIREALLDWNAHVGERLGVKVEPVLWESHARPEMGSGAQEIINERLVDDCDFGIAVFWSRLGSPTAKHASGSVEEIERMLARGADVMVYFCDSPIPQAALADDQYQCLQDLKRSFRDRGLVGTYTQVDELRRVISLHVHSLLLTPQLAFGTPIPSRETATAPTSAIAEIAAQTIAAAIPFATSLKGQAATLILHAKHSRPTRRASDQLQLFANVTDRMNSEQSAFNTAANLAEAYLPEDALDTVRKLRSLYAEIDEGWVQHAIFGEPGHGCNLAVAASGLSRCQAAMDAIQETLGELIRVLRRYSAGSPRMFSPTPEPC